jgi:hypothetical protein
MGRAIRIESGIPIPCSWRTGVTARLRNMKAIGDAFLLPVGASVKATRVSAARLGIAVSIRRNKTGRYRVWRIK